MNFRNDIQGLRALAVLFVFIFHLSATYLPGGFVGVDMFFVISGYLISKIVLFKINSNKFNIIHFYIGRVKRIVPAYYFLLIGVWILFLFVFANSDIGKFKMSHFWTVLFNSNNYFSTLDDYFGASSNENPLLHTWTLAVEMQFYFFLPVLLLVFRNKRILLGILICAIIALVGYSTIEIMKGNKGDMYYSLLSRSPEFFIGVVASLLNVEEKDFVKRNSLAISSIGAIGIFLCAFFLNENSPFPGILAVIPCLATAMILVSRENKLNTWLSNKMIVFVGEISYSIYLWHWPIMAFLRYHNDRYEFTAMESLIIIALTVGASLFSYYLIERPLRGRKGRSFVIPLIILIIFNVAMIYYVVPVKNKISNIPSEYLFPSFGVDSHGKDFKKVGVYGDKNSVGKRILLLGDSHGLTFKPYLDTLGKKHSFSFRAITNDVYPAIPGLTKNEITESSRYKVYQTLSPYINSETTLADVIIVYFAKDGTRWKKPLFKFLSALRVDQKVLVMSDYPFLDKNPVRFNRSLVKDNTRTQEYKLVFPKTDPEILERIQNMSNVKYVNFSHYDNFFIDAPFHNDTLMYYDATHLNYFGSVKYAERTGGEFMKYLNWALE